MRIQEAFLASIAIVVSAAAPARAQTGGVPSQMSGGVSASGPKFTVLRSMAGTSGTENNGKLVIDNPQTIFHLGHDPKVIVYFEWKGPIGPHKFEGLWKNPEGKIVLISDFQYAATTDQFAGYWTMLLSGSEATGIWTLEARIDGEAGGSFPFQLVTEPGAEAPKAAPVRQPLAPSDIYQRAVAATVFVDNVDDHGKVVGHASGFFLDDGRLLTAFQNIDGATQIRITFPDGRSQQTDQVVMWNRWQDWAILGVSAPKNAGIPRATTPGSVGSVAYYLETSSGASRVISSVNVVGETDFPRAGHRFNISTSPGSAAIGSPLVDEFGDVIGMVGGSLTPGANLLESYLLMESSAGSSGNIIRDGLAVPISLIPAAAVSGAAASLADLTSKGQMLPLVTDGDKILTAQFTPTMSKTPGMMTPRGERQQYSHADKTAYIYVYWSPHSKIKGAATMSLYDADNRIIGESKPVKINLNTGSIASATWQVPVEKLPAGIYRVDVALGASLVWRKFFRVTE